MRFVCAGDLHLGAGADLGREPGDRLREQEAVLDRIVAVANELDASLLFAGDAWERRRPTPEEILAFRRPLEKLERGGLAITGNHDVEAFGRATGYDVFAGLTGIAAVSKPTVWPMPGGLVACLPWAPPSHLVALEGGGDRDDLNRRLAEGLVEIARGLYAQVEDERGRRSANGATLPTPAILLAHWSVSGASVPSGIPVELFREPVLDLDDLAAIGFDAVVLGHIHKPQVLNAAPRLKYEDRPPIFYVGSPMPLNFGETGVPHGGYLLDVEPGKAEVYFVPIESRRLVTLDVEPSDPAFTAEQVADAVVKVRIRATRSEARSINVGEVKRRLEALGAHKVWAIQVEAERDELVRGPAIDETIDDVEAFRLWLEASGVTISPIDGGPLPALEEELLERHSAYLQEMNR